MPQKVRGVLRDELMKKVAGMMMEKIPPSEIATRLSVSTQFVKRAEELIRKEWKKKDSIDNARNRVLGEERHLRQVYWETFKEDRALMRPGHPFLKGIGESLERERKLLGLDMPTRITMSELDNELGKIFKELQEYNTVSGEVIALLPEKIGNEPEKEPEKPPEADHKP